jgi:hypothetical protein
MFNNAKKLETIEMIMLDGPSGDMTGAFTGCDSLKNIRFSGPNYITGSINIGASPLTNESITSIVNALSPTESGKTATFSQTAVNNAFEGGSTGSEWLNLIATKSNWTISLV